MDFDDLSRRLDDTETRLSAIHGARLESEFRRLTGGASSDRDGIDARERSIVADPAWRELLITVIGGADFTVEQKRRAELLAREAHDGTVRTDPGIAAVTRLLEDSLLSFRPWLAGKPARFVEIEDTLHHEPDRNLREAAWLAMAPLGADVEAGVAQLLQLRNSLARDAGYGSFPEMAFEANGIDRFEFLALCDEIEQLTRSPYEELLGRLRGDFGKTLEPWDVAFGIERLSGAEEIPREAFSSRLAYVISGWGLPASELPVTLHEADTIFRAVCLPVARDDIRIVGEFTDGAQSLEAFLRMQGIALYYHQVTAGEGVFCRDRSPIAEASGMLVRSLGMHEVTSSTSFRKSMRLRLAIASSLFEILAYERPDGDLHSLHSEIFEHYLGFPRHPERLWAADPRIATRPFHATSTVLAFVIASQLTAGLSERFGHALSPEAGKALRAQLWGPGASIPWSDRLESLTGRSLDPDALLRELGSDIE